ncbi:MAG: hypothetical protein LBB63_03500, partial [Holosporaceae bacterium]|nr:hypothetical protein [Holosporaceae bacterium]
TSSSSKSTPEGSVCSSSNESSISFAEEQKGKLTPESIIALLRKKVNSAVPTDIYLIQKNLCCLPLSKWLEPDLIAGGFLEEFFARTALEMMLLSTIDRLYLENGLNPKRVADILETTRDSSERNLIDIIIQCAEIDRNSAFCILRHYFISTYEIPFSKETSKKIKTVRRNTAGL